MAPRTDRAPQPSDALTSIFPAARARILGVLITSGSTPSLPALMFVGAAKEPNFSTTRQSGFESLLLMAHINPIKIAAKRGSEVDLARLTGCGR